MLKQMVFTHIIVGIIYSNTITPPAVEAFVWVRVDALVCDDLAR